MQLVNHTPFPALAFESITADGTQFHTVVLRQTLELREGSLAFAQTQKPLATTDRFYEEPNRSSLVEESDLAPYKPMCDVLVSGVAYAPTGQPMRRFATGVRIVSAPTASGPDVDAPSQTAQQAASAERRVLLDHRIDVTGPRDFERCSGLTRWANALIAFATLGGVRRPNWKLTSPAPIISVPIRYEYAWGGQCRVDANDPAAARLPKASRMAVDERQAHPDGPSAPIAHTVCERNPVGTGYSEAWFIDAVKPKRIRAPQLELPSSPITAQRWLASLRAKDSTELQPVGFGPIGKAWLPRRSLAGTFDERWLREQHPNLPRDFRFEYWNCAHPAMQAPHLKGDETIVLLNLLPAGTPGSNVNPQGDTEVHIRLPGHLPMGWVYGGGALKFAAFLLDTVLLDLSGNTAPQVTLVWRATVPKSAGIDQFEVRFIEAAERKRLAMTQADHVDGALHE